MKLAVSRKGASDMRNSGLLHIVFEYRDRYSQGMWLTQECMVSSVEECKRIYGLGVDCEYHILLVEQCQ